MNEKISLIKAYFNSEEINNNEEYCVKRRPDMSESGVNYYFRFSHEHFMIHTPKDNKLILLPTKY